VVNIYEYQYEVDDRNNSQNRIISSYSSFEEYVDYLLNDKSKEVYNSLPRQCNIIDHKINGNAITLEFHHSLFNKNMIHTAILMED
jgi:hypothetical protein